MVSWCVGEYILPDHYDLVFYIKLDYYLLSWEEIKVKCGKY